MTEPATGRSWTWLNPTLVALLVLVLALTAVVWFSGPGVLPGKTSAQRAADSYGAVRDAARKEVGAFLTLDYKNMDPLVQKVLDGATGKFRKQYRASKVGLESAARSARVEASGKVRYVGIDRLRGKTATVFVAADGVVSNKHTEKVQSTRACPHDGAVCRYYRFKIEMTSTPEGWKISDLGYVS